MSDNEREKELLDAIIYFYIKGFRDGQLADLEPDAKRCLEIFADYKAKKKENELKIT